MFDMQIHIEKELTNEISKYQISLQIALSGVSVSR